MARFWAPLAVGPWGAGQVVEDFKGSSRSVALKQLRPLPAGTPLANPCPSCGKLFLVGYYYGHLEACVPDGGPTDDAHPDEATVDDSTDEDVQVDDAPPDEATVDDSTDEDVQVDDATPDEGDAPPDAPEAHDDDEA